MTYPTAGGVVQSSTSENIGFVFMETRFPLSNIPTARLVLYDFPLATDKSWCPHDPLPDNVPSCRSNGLRTVQRQLSHATPAGTFGDCYEISEEYTSGGVWEWFCDGIGTVERKYDHSGTRFGFQYTLIGFRRGAEP